MNTEMVHLSSREILWNIFKCVFIFYSIYYISCSICTGAFSIRPFNGKMPFDFVQWIDLTKCCASYPALQLANFISMEATYLVSTGAYILTLPTRLWDYAITITLFHILLSCLVMLSFPTNWSWWICLGSGQTFMAVVGETTLYGLKKLKQRREIMPIVEALEAGR